MCIRDSMIWGWVLRTLYSRVSAHLASAHCSTIDLLTTLCCYYVVIWGTEDAAFTSLHFTKAQPFWVTAVGIMCHENCDCCIWDATSLSHCPGRLWLYCSALKLWLTNFTLMHPTPTSLRVPVLIQFNLLSCWAHCPVGWCNAPGICEIRSKVMYPCQSRQHFSYQSRTTGFHKVIKLSLIHI